MYISLTTHLAKLSKLAICVLTALPAVLYVTSSAPTLISISSASPVVEPLGREAILSIRAPSALSADILSLVSVLILLLRPLSELALELASEAIEA